MTEPIVVAGKTCHFIASAVGGCTISDRDDYNGSFLSDGKWGHVATVFRDEAAARAFAAKHADHAHHAEGRGEAMPDGVSMVVLDPGHDYLIRSLDGGAPIRITFVKREGEHYPGNVGHYGGTIMQRLVEVIDDRLSYVNNQLPCWESELAQWLARGLKAVLEVRAARTHGRHLEYATVAKFMAALPCTKCGHTGCDRHSQRKEPTHD